MQYRILGPLELLDGEGRDIVLGGGRERVVLGALLLNANRVVSTDRMIEALWGDRPPETAMNALQVHISKLRKLLGTTTGPDSPIRTQPPGYTLKVASGELDAERFERLTAASRPDEGLDAVSARLTEALGLWRGPVLEGLDADTFGRAEVTRLEELRITTLERRIEADLALGRHREITGELEALVRTHPLRESLRGQLMVAFYRSGRQADALAAYRRSREFLADELGIDPSPELQALELAVLNQSSDLDLPTQLPMAGPTESPGVGTSSPPISTGGPTTIPLPGRLAAHPSVGVVGREDELQIIADAYKRVAETGGCEVVLVAGEAGLGKTTLVAEAARRAFDHGARVLFGHCEEDLASPYQFFAESLGHLATHASDQELLAHIRAHGSEISRLLPVLSTRFTELPPSTATDSDTERYLLFAAAVGLVTDASHSQPVVLVLDDLQWADKGSLLLLRHLAAAEPVQRVLILATYRDNELMHADALRDTLGVLRRHNGVQRIDLVGLDDREVVSYFEAASGQTLDDDGVDLAHAVYRETDGNPFFVGEILRHLTETGAIYRSADGRWVAGEALAQTVLPDSVREVIGSRVVRLGKDAEHVLSMAAVIGRDFDLDLLARASRVPDDAVLDLLDAAGGAALVTELTGTPGRFQFTHALIQATLYQNLGPTRRARAHRQVAEALEELCGSRPELRVGELARHWVAAIQPIDLAKAINYSRQAGDVALAALAPADAVRYYSQALELSSQSPDPDPLVELDATIGLGTAMRQTGDSAFRDTLLKGSRQAVELGDTDRLVAAALGNNRGTFSTVSAIDEEKVTILEAALERLVANDERRALVLATLCTELTVGSSLERRRDLADEALAIAERSGDDATVVRVINQILLPLSVPHLLEVSTERSRDALSRAESIGDPALLCTAASGRRLFAAAAGDIEEMDRCFEIKRPLVERLDLPFLHWVHTLQGATRAVIAGDPNQAEQLALRALQTGTDGGQPDAAIVFGTQLIMVHLLRGTLGTLVPLIEQAIADNPGLPVFTAVLALAHADSDRIEETRQILEGFALTNFQLPLDVTWLTGMIACADATSACGDRRFAGPILDQLEPFSDQWLCTDVATSGPVSRSIGDLMVVLGRYDEAESHFANSAASSEKADARFFSAQTDLSWGRMLLERRAPGDSERAKDFLGRSRQSAALLGYATVERRAAAALELAHR
jgi:DNA-binding SARP family transcriptional activator